MQSCVCTHSRYAIKVKWLWKNKMDPENMIIRNKYCLVAKGYSQQEGIDFEASCAPVARLDTVCAMKFFLGLNIHQSPCVIFINQLQYTLGLLRKHGMEKCDTVMTSLATAKIDADLQDITSATFICARYQARPTETHLKEVKRIFRYLRQTYNIGIQFLGDKLVSWSSKKQDCTTMSTVEAEYVSLSACCAQVIWMRTQLLDYGYRYNKIPIYYDSKSAITISCNPVQHSRTKHINIRYHFMKEHVEKGTIELYFVGTEYQLADLFTKALLRKRFEYLVHRIGMRCMIPTQLERLTKLSS
ncbi:copia protein [Tanacetum coccineum]